MYDLLKRLFPICRSITGDGVRETLKILKEYIPLTIYEVSTGTQVFDWVIPQEWNIRDAYVKNSQGERIIDFKKNNLHIINYSTPINGTFTLNQLTPHLYSLPENPDAIPYITSYYKPRWGFCISHKQKMQLREDLYEVFIDSNLKDGFLTYADLLIKGDSDQEVLISTYHCHPSLANNELSGPVIATFLARELLSRKNLRYSYRFVFVPETIGSITYISRMLSHLKEKVIAGYVITCAGDSGNFSYLRTRKENTLVDRITEHVLKNTESHYKIYNYLERGSDERQYCAPGIDLEVGSLMRSKYGTYSEYHTSLDNLDFVDLKSLQESLDKYIMCIDVFEKNRIYKNTSFCEPQLGKRGLYPTLGTRKNESIVKNMMNILAYSDGHTDLLTIAEKINCPFHSVTGIVQDLLNSKILIEV